MTVRTVRAALAALVFLAAGAVFFERAERVGYNTDEGQAIWPSQYFQFVFLDRQLAGPMWDETYWTLTQVPFYRYIIGAGIWLSGNPIPEVDLEHRIDEVRGPDREKYFDPRTYRDERRLAEQRRVPRPEPEVIRAARLPMVLLGAGTAALLFLVAAQVTGPIFGSAAGLAAGLAAAASFVAAPFVQTLIPRAHTEAPFLFFLALALWLALRAAQDASRRDLTLPAPLSEGERGETGSGPADPPGSGGRRMRFTVLAGLAAGLSAASKLTGVLELAALGAFAAGAFILDLLARRAPALAAQVGPGAALRRSWRWSALAAAVGLLAFLAVNPFLWPDPVGRTRAMLAFRQQEMFGQRTLNEELAVPEHLPTRIGLVLRQSFVGEVWVARRTGVPLEAGLALVGAVVLLARVARSRRDGGLVGTEAVLLVWFLVVALGTAVNLGIDWDRYYLPTVALGLVIVGVGTGAIVDGARRLVSRRPAPTATAATPPPMPTARSGSAG